MRQGHWYEAHYNLTQALRLESFHYAEASYNLGRLYATQGQMDLAIREWRRALSVNPNHSAATQAMLRARIEDVITVSSQQANKGTSGLKGSNEPGTATTNIGSAGSLPTASSSKDLRIDPVTYSHLQRARSARERGKNEEALKHYRVVISRLGGYFGPANLELSYVLIALMQQDAALDNLRALTSKDGSRYPVGFYHLGRIYEARGDFEEAAEAFGQAARYYADANPQFLLDVSRVREKLGDYNRALAALQEYLAAMERQGMKPQWAEERLAALRQKAAAAQK
jgi:predicted negative regulator of RcsB-dependent stress response